MACLLRVLSCSFQCLFVSRSYVAHAKFDAFHCPNPKLDSDQVYLKVDFAASTSARVPGSNMYISVQQALNSRHHSDDGGGPSPLPVIPSSQRMRWRTMVYHTGTIDSMHLTAG